MQRLQRSLFCCCLGHKEQMRDFVIHATTDAWHKITSGCRLRFYICLKVMGIIFPFFTRVKMKQNWNHQLAMLGISWDWFLSFVRSKSNNSSSTMKSIMFWKQIHQMVRSSKDTRSAGLSALPVQKWNQWSLHHFHDICICLNGLRMLRNSGRQQTKTLQWHEVPQNPSRKWWSKCHNSLLWFRWKMPWNFGEDLRNLTESQV